MDDASLIRILCQLAEEEKIYVESEENDTANPPRWMPRVRWGPPNSEETVDVAPHMILGGTSRYGSVWRAVSGFAWNAATRMWGYVTSNYIVTARVQLLPADDLIMRYPFGDPFDRLRNKDKFDDKRKKLARGIRDILREHSVVDLKTVTDEILKDSSLVRQIVLKYLIEFLIDELDLPVRIPITDNSEEEEPVDS